MTDDCSAWIVEAMGIDTQAVSIFDVGLSTLSYEDAASLEEAHRMIRQARWQSPIAMGRFGLEVISYDLACTALRDTRFAVPQGIGLVVQGITSGPMWDRITKLLVNLDGAAHHRLRRLVSQAFTPRTCSRMRSACIEVITELVEAHTAVGRCDIVADIARPYPVQIICALLGVPRHDWALFSQWTDDISKIFGSNVAEDTPAILRAWDDLEGYVEELIAARRHCLTDDLISQLLRAEDNGYRLSHDELVNLLLILLNVGTDTTRNQLAAAIQVLCDHPDQWELLAAHPELAPHAVEEILRHTPIVFTSLRTATDDIELGGFHIPAGMSVIINTAAANHDPSVFNDPERFDITRRGVPAVLTFCGGVHYYSVGAHLARLELTEALRVITRRIQNPRLTGPAPWKPLLGVTGPTTLPIEFDTGHQ
jgi:cytochrome P450